MSQGYQINDPSATYFLTLKVVDWVDISAVVCGTQNTFRSVRHSPREKSISMGEGGFSIFLSHIRSPHQTQTIKNHPTC